MIVKRMEFSYSSRDSKDPYPNVIVLGEYLNKKGNIIICGLNLNYLNESEVEDLYEQLPSIIDSAGDMIQTYMNGCLVAHDIFEDSYRKYDETKMTNVKEHIIELNNGHIEEHHG